ncbi:MAG: phosphonate ABC transporter ATP-binding protein [Alphaproteobacteria bacterium]
MLRSQSPISVNRLSVSYTSGARALAPTTLSFERGAFTVLLGASGAGKSTLLRTLNGLVKPSEGEIRVDGAALVGSAALRAHRRTTGMVFQQHQLIGRLTALDNVMIGRLGYHSTIRTLFPFSRSEKLQGLDALERVGLIEFALRRADQLSGGQQQRVGIARALVQRPRIILADEPVASLDPATAEGVLALLHGIARQDGLTAIVSLHQIDFARHFADRIIALAKGEVVFDGTPGELGEAEIARIYSSKVSTHPDIKEIAA